MQDSYDRGDGTPHHGRTEIEKTIKNRKKERKRREEKRKNQKRIRKL
jgi:hypothetical protein